MEEEIQKNMAQDEKENELHKLSKLQVSPNHFYQYRSRPCFATSPERHSEMS